KEKPQIGGDFLLVFTCSIQLSLLFHLFQCYLQPCGSWSNFFLILLNFYTICPDPSDGLRSEEHTSELQSRFELVCRLLLAKKNMIDMLPNWSPATDTTRT